MMAGRNREGRSMSSAQLPAISHLSADAKKQLLLLLARDLMGASGAPVSMRDATGEVVVYAPAADARERAERALRSAPPARLAELRRRAETPDRSFSVEEVLGPPERPADRTQ
jgi:hypothetical protein